VHQFLGEQNGLNETTAPYSTENSQPHNFFLLYLQMMLAVIAQKTNQYKQQMHKQEISQILHILSK
jgi:hypothetical protein